MEQYRGKQENQRRGIIKIKSFRESTAPPSKQDLQLWPSLSHELEPNTRKILKDKTVNDFGSFKNRIPKAHSFNEAPTNIWTKRAEIRVIKEYISPSSSNQSDNAKAERKLVSEGSERAHTHLKNDKNSCSTLDGIQTFEQHSDDVVAEEWISVRRKGNKKVTEITNDECNKEDIHAKSTNDEKRVKYREQRKAQLKEKKKFEREAKARLQRQQASRDTKLQVIPQELIDKYMNPSKAASSTTNAFEVTQSKPKKSSKVFSGSMQADSSLSYSSKISSGLRNHSSYSSAASAKYSSNQDRQNAKMHPSSKSNEIETRKKVKKKDLITFDLMAAIKKPIQKKPKTGKNFGYLVKQDKKEPKRGKVRKKKIKLSKLKVTMQAEKKMRLQIFFACLNEQMAALCVKEPDAEVEDTPTIPLDDLPSPHSSRDTNINAVNLRMNRNKSITASKIGDADTISKEMRGSHAPASLETMPSAILNSSDAIEPISSYGSPSKKANESEVPEIPSTIELSGVDELDKSMLPNWQSSLSQELMILQNPVHSRKFREYCDQLVTPEINASLQEFIKMVVTFQKNLFNRDPIKAKMKQRYYCGLKETLKHMHQMTCVIIPPSLQRSPGPGNLDDTVLKVIRGAKEMKVPIIFGLNGYFIGRLCYRKGTVSALGIVSYDGARDQFAELMKLVTNAKDAYKDLLMKHGLAIPTEGVHISS